MMQLRSNTPLIVVVAAVITAAVLFSSPAVSAQPHIPYSLPNSGSFNFTIELGRLQEEINYKFQNIWHLRMAMTHSSYSDENNEGLSIIGSGIINTTIASIALTDRLNYSSKALSQRLSMWNNEAVFAGFGMFLRLEYAVRVSPNFDSSNSSIVGGAFKALLGAIALDSRKFTDAEKLFWGFVVGDFRGIVRYEFKNRELKLRALTHSSYSKENNKALSILGQSIIETAVALNSLTRDLYMSSCDLNKKLKETRGDSCIAIGRNLRLHEKVRVSSSTDASTPSVFCGAFRSLIGAKALDSGESDIAVDWLWSSLISGQLDWY